MKKFSGIVVPAITPLNIDLTIDIQAVDRIVRLFNQHGIHPLLLGTTGESSSINEAESLRLLQTAINAKGEKQHIYAGLVGNQVEELVHRANKYLSIGADCVVATLPSYYTLTPDQMKNFYLHLADNISGPLMIYNIKATTQMSIPLDIIVELSNHPNIVGLKDSERDLERMFLCIDTYKDRSDFSYFCGWGAQSFGSLHAGADGIVPSTANIVPDMYEHLYKAAIQKDWHACETWQKLTDYAAERYQKNCTLGESLAKLKKMMADRGLCKNIMMPPLTNIV
jgi:dihydrodipicolinate synthase/N-acetylneuraminate lyase